MWVRRTAGRGALGESGLRNMGEEVAVTMRAKNQSVAWRWDVKCSTKNTDN